MLICSHMKDVVMIVSCPLLPPGAGELLEEEAAMLTIGWAMVSYISCEPTPLGGVQGATNMVTYGSPILWLFCFDGWGLHMIIFPNLRIICQVLSKPGFGNFT